MSVLDETNTNLKGQTTMTTQTTVKFMIDTPQGVDVINAVLDARPGTVWAFGHRVLAVAAGRVQVQTSRDSFNGGTTQWADAAMVGIMADDTDTLLAAFDAWAGVARSSQAVAALEAQAPGVNWGRSGQLIGGTDWRRA
jgi:hypothetical protein